MEIENSSRGILMAFFRQSRAFLFVFTLILAGGTTYLIMATPLYEAQGSLVVKFGNDGRPDTGVNERLNTFESDPNGRREIIQSYIKIIFSHDMLRNLVKDFGPLQLYPNLEEEKEEDPNVPLEELAVEKLLEDDLKVTHDQSHVIFISVLNENPGVAKDFAARAMQAFVRKRTEIYNKPQTDFLEKQIQEARERLQRSQNELQAFKQEAGISDIDEEMAQLLREKSELNALAYAAITEAQSKVAELESQEARMRSTYRRDSPLLTRFQRIVAVARAELEQRKNDLNASTESGSSLGLRMANVDKRLSYLESQRGRYNDLLQKVKIDEENYLYYLQRGEEARVNNLLNQQNITRISVLDHPALPVEPVRPRKNIFLAVTFLAATMAGIGTAFSRELLDDRLSNPDQVYNCLSIPVLATFEKEY